MVNMCVLVRLGRVGVKLMERKWDRRVKCGGAIESCGQEEYCGLGKSKQWTIMKNNNSRAVLDLPLL